MISADNQGEKENKENEEQEEEQVEKERRAEQPERQMEMEEADEPSASLEEAVTPATATPSDRVFFLGKGIDRWDACNGKIFYFLR